METAKKLSVIFLVMIMLVSVGMVSVSAETKTTDGITVSFETDKKKYTDDETVIGKFEILNVSANDIQDIDARMIMPKGYAINEGSVMSYSYDVINVGGSVDGEITCVPNAENHRYKGVFWTGGRIALMIGGIVGLVVVLFVVGLIAFFVNSKKTENRNTTSLTDVTALFLAVSVGISVMMCSVNHVSAVSSDSNSVILTESVQCGSVYIPIQFMVSFKMSNSQSYQFTTADNPQTEANVYETTVKNLMDKYGQGEVIKQQLNGSEQYCIQGLGLVKTIDFDKDGNDELLCVCGSYKDNNYTAEMKLYRANGKKVQTVYEDTCIYQGKNTTYYTEFISEDIGILLHTKTSHVHDVNDEWSKLTGNKVSVARTLKSKMENNNVWIYTVDGSNVTAQAFNTQLEHFDNHKQSFPMNNQTNPEPLYSILQATKNTVTYLAPTVTYVFSEQFLPQPTEPPTERPTVKPQETPVEQSQPQQQQQQQQSQPQQQQPQTTPTQPPAQSQNGGNSITVIPPQSNGGVTIISPQGGGVYGGGVTPYSGGGYYSYGYSYPYGRGVVRDWRSAYKEKLTQLSRENANAFFELCDTDNDGIPELFHSVGNSCYLYVWNGYNVEKTDFVSPYAVAYVDCSGGYIGLPSFDGGYSPTTIYKKSSSGVSRVIEYRIDGGYYGEVPYYIVNNRSVSEREYWSSVQTYENIRWKDVGRSCPFRSSDINKTVDCWR